jgi:PAS domain S-box-containing protein
MEVLPSNEKNANSTWKILIIDDDEDDFILTREMLRDARGRTFAVQWANSFERGREELAGDTYHAVLVDYDLGARSGIDLIREASARGYGAPLILFTGRGNYEADVEAMEAGATLYLTKGEVNPLLLERSIRYAIELKHKEQALKKAEERFAKAFHSSPAALAITRAADGRYIEANESLCQLTGYRREEIIGHTALELGLYADPAQRAELVRLLQEQGAVRNYEVVVRTKGGDLCTLLGSFDMVELDNEACLLATLIDITERKRVEEALRSSEDKYQAIFQAAPFSLILASLDNGVILDVNKGWEELFGITRQEAVGKTALELGTVPEPEYRARGYQELREHGRLRNFEMPYRTRAGKPFIVCQSAEIIEINSEKYLLAVTEDITARKQAEQDLAKEHARMEAVLQAMPVGVWIADQTGQLIFKNKQTDQIWGGDAPLSTSIEGYREYVAWFMDSGKPVAAEDFPVAQALRTGEQARPAELRIQRFDGSEGAVLAIGAPIKDPDGQLTGAVAVNVDITERKQAEQALRESEEKIRRSNQELEQFAFVASHDLKEPLRKITLFGDRLQSRAKETLDAESLHYLERMQNAAERMQVMINGLLELSRINRQGREFTKIHLKTLVGDVVSDLESRIQAAGGEVHTGDLPTLEADELQMRQLFQNLIGNALKFHRPGVPPIVRVSGAPGPAKKAALVEILVEDNGIGFEQKDAGRLFQPFQRLHGRNEYEGTGLGLAICQKIVERHHGTIEVQSVPEQGTMFIIRLPVKQNTE